MKQFYFTEAGYQKLKEEIERLERLLKKEVAQEIAAAREHGDLSENAEYDAAKEKQAKYMARLGQLRERFVNARIIRKEDLPADIVTLGKTVKIRDVNNGEVLQYTILGDGETDLEKGIISYQAPLANQLLRHKVGDTVEVQLPRGLRTFEILEVTFFEDV
jgi:transcription elongation factor GreA